MLKFGKIDFIEVNVEENEESFNYVKKELGFSHLPVVEADGLEPFEFSKNNVADFIKKYEQ